MHRKRKSPGSFEPGLSFREPDDALLSRQLSHYHRRKGVSRSCSGWEGVVPPRYGRQAKLSTIMIFNGKL